MRKLCLVTFDITREGEAKTSYSAGSLLSFLKSRKEYGDAFSVTHKSYDLYQNPQMIFDWGEGTNWDDFEFVAVSCYIWSHDHSRSLMRWLKDQKFKCRIIAGGYQINLNNENWLRGLYPDADIFILSYAEQALYEILTAKTPTKTILSCPVNFELLPSPYSDGTISIDEHVTKIRLETKRGCPFGCTFCAQHDLNQRKTQNHLEEKLLEELNFLAGKGLKRISVSDPVFNMGKTFIPYLKAIRENQMTGVFNFQVRPELILPTDDEFIELLAETNSEIELGLQTFDPVVNRIINRGNDYPKIETSLKRLIENNVDFGISLIYGLPGQTLASFEKDLEKVHSMNIQNVVAFPLMILPGTPMYNEKELHGIEEGIIDETYRIPHVVSSHSFTNSEWRKMHEMASKLSNPKRLF